MSDENEFWLKTTKVLCFALCIITIASIASCQMTNMRIREAIEAGAHPIDAVCALSSSCDQAICGGRAAK